MSHVRITEKWFILVCARACVRACVRVARDQTLGLMHLRQVLYR
jgi:hypothetical protein